MFSIVSARVLGLLGADAGSLDLDHLDAHVKVAALAQVDGVSDGLDLDSIWLCQVNSPRGTMPGCTFDDPATFGIAFRLKSSATPSGCITDTA